MRIKDIFGGFRVGMTTYDIQRDSARSGFEITSFTGEEEDDICNSDHKMFFIPDEFMEYLMKFVK